MGNMREEIVRSLKLNKDLAKMLKQGIELNKPIKIGWSREGEPIPKKGEIGLAPALPEKGRVRILGELGHMNGILCQGGSFSLEGSSGDFHGAWNNGGSHVIERKVGDHLGHGMSDGEIIARDGCGKFAGSSLKGGLLIIRGDAGSQLGAGMKGGTILVVGDVGDSVGSRMIGGRILVTGRCPKPGEGAKMTNMSKNEIDKFNESLNDDLLKISDDVVCIIADDSLEVISKQPNEKILGDWSELTIVPEAGKNRLVKGQALDTIVVLGGDEIPSLESNIESMGLDLPLIFESEKSMKDFSTIVNTKPKDSDFLIINEDNIQNAHKEIKNAGGVIIDLSSMPTMSPPSLDGLLVAIRAISTRLIPILLKDGLSRVNNLHTSGKNHPIQGVIVNLSDISGLHAASCLPKIGRSIIETKIDSSTCPTFISVPWQVSSNDIIIARGCGAAGIISKEPQEMVKSSKDIHYELRGWLEELGLDSIEKIERKHLRSNSHEIAALSGIRLTGYERALPMWFSQ
tara:strand:+ start:864 stop:2408 length:1545 start_codon:yes stop_codon:yes gene_type:complete